MSASVRVAVLALAAALLAGLLPGCGDEEPAGLVLRPGDSLLDLQALARVHRPATSLPAELAALAAAPSLKLRSPTVLAAAWAPVENVLPSLQALLDQHGRQTLWRARAPVRSLEDGPAPGVWVDGRPAALDPGVSDGTLVWWDRPSGGLLAAGESPPGEVALDAWVDPAAEFGDVEGAGREGLRRFELGDTTRRGLLLPAPSRWELALDGLAAERLEVSVGLLDRAWTLRDGTTFRASGLSDGATFAVEALREGQQPRRLWSLTLDAEAVGAQFHDASIDLSGLGPGPWTISLVTEPGPSGSPDFDYAVWGGLRLAGGTRRAPTRPHLVLIDIDTLRADRVGPRADGTTLTPGLDAWAAEHAVRYTDAISTASWTLPATISMLTGLAVHQHGVERATGALGGGASTLAEQLAAHGYETRAVAAGGYLRPTFGLDQGFDSYRSTDPQSLDWSPELAFVQTRDSDRPLFLFVHTYFVHAPYRHDPQAAPADYTGPLAGQDVDYPNVLDPYRAGELLLDAADEGYVTALYDGLVRQMDTAVAELLDGLQAAFGDEPLAVVFTSDHGEAFFEHALLGHGHAVWDELLRVPLLVAFPDGRGAGTTVAAPVGLLDVVPTLLDLGGLPIPESLPGTSLAGALPEQRVRVARHSQQEHLRAILDAGYKLIEAGPADGDRPERLELYHLGDDPGEQRPLGDEALAQRRALRHRLDAFEREWPALDAATSSDDASMAAVEDELRKLGYLGDDDEQRR